MTSTCGRITGVFGVIMQDTIFEAIAYSGIAKTALIRIVTTALPNSVHSVVIFFNTEWTVLTEFLEHLRTKSNSSSEAGSEFN